MADIVYGDKEVLINNDTVEVVRLTYPAGSQSGMHTHQYPHRVVYVAQGGVIELKPSQPDKSSKVLNLKTGQALYLPATTHNVINVGESEVVLVETEIK
ncbi:hypothetical protein GCM10022277_13830 [Litoribacillus peritrichatus]|uniref:Cupin type-2 domain-containing protein n=2 Tax=Litoribacillus peritrichatus TaxID=718191 RepID=A0ABP7MFU0_9GAMM